MKLKKAKVKALCLDWGSTQYQYGMGKGWMQSSSVKDNLGMLLNEKLNINWKYGVAALKGSHILGYIENSMDSRLKKVILPFWSCDTHLVYCIQQLCSPQNKDVGGKPKRWSGEWSNSPMMTG